MIYDYDADLGSFTASGDALEWRYDAETKYNITGGTFNINATIDDSGIANSGTLNIGGTVSGPGFNFNSGTLLKGTLTAFGFPDTVGVSDPFEFLFTVTGGDLEGDIGPVAGVILTNTDFGGSFAEDFANNGTEGISDTGTPVPVPATLPLLMFGCGWLYALRKRLGPKNS